MNPDKLEDVLLELRKQAQQTIDPLYSTPLGIKKQILAALQTKQRRAYIDIFNTESYEYERFEINLDDYRGLQP